MHATIGRLTCGPHASPFLNRTPSPFARAGMDWLCPAYDSALHAQLAKHYGNITAENTISDITAIVQTGAEGCAERQARGLAAYCAHAGVWACFPPFFLCCICVVAVLSLVGLVALVVV